MTEAIARFRKAAELDDNLDVVPEAEADTWLADALLVYARQSAREGDVKQAARALITARQRNPTLHIDAATQVRDLVTAAALENARELAGKGDVAAATSKFELAVELNHALDIDPRFDSRWLASQALLKAAQEHLDAERPSDAIPDLERAVELSPRHGLATGCSDGPTSRREISTRPSLI